MLVSSGVLAFCLQLVELLNDGLTVQDLRVVSNLAVLLLALGNGIDVLRVLNRPGNNSRLSRNLDFITNIFFENAFFLTFSLTLKVCDF